MLDIKFTESKKAVLLTPSDDLSAANIAQLTETLNAHINQTDKVPNLVIHIASLPHWDSLDALNKHLKLVQDHHKLIKKVAIVTDNFLVKSLHYVMDHFVAAKVRQFSEFDLDEAMRWAESEEDHPGNFEWLGSFPDDVIALKASGIITSQDYRDTLVPAIEEKLKKHEHLKLLMVFGDEFEAYSEAAAWDDMRLGFHHIGDFSKIGIVTDEDWIRRGVKIFAPLMRGQVNLFKLGDLQKAYAWIKS